MKLREDFIHQNRYNIKATHQMTPEFIIIHNTANDASAKNEIAYMSRNNNYTSFHIAVDDIEAIQAIPFSRNSWSAGDGSNGKGNRKGIAIEICYSKSGGAKFDKAEANAAKVTADILKKYNWGIDKVKKHQDFSGKYCPHRTLDRGWQRFLNMVQAELRDATVKATVWYAKDKKDNDKQGVIELQKDLVKLGFPVGSYGANGIFGNDTENAVRNFQKANSLTVDGSAGPSTLEKIAELLKPKPPKVEDGELYKVQVGAYSDKANAEKKLEELKKRGQSGFIKKE